MPAYLSSMVHIYCSPLVRYRPPTLGPALLVIEEQYRTSLLSDYRHIGPKTSKKPENHVYAAVISSVMDPYEQKAPLLHVFAERKFERRPNRKM